MNVSEWKLMKVNPCKCNYAEEERWMQFIVYNYKWMQMIASECEWMQVIGYLKSIH